MAQGEEFETIYSDVFIVHRTRRRTLVSWSKCVLTVCVCWEQSGRNHSLRYRYNVIHCLVGVI